MPCAADRHRCILSFAPITVCSRCLLVAGVCGLNMFVCVCVCVFAFEMQGCVWDAAQVSVGVCWTTSLQGTGYQAEMEAIMLITLHTPCQPSVQHKCWAHTHTDTYTYTQTHWHTHLSTYTIKRAHRYAQNHPSFPFILSFLCLPPFRCLKALDINSLLLSRKIVLYSNQFNSVLWN